MLFLLKKYEWEQAKIFCRDIIDIALERNERCWAASSHPNFLNKIWQNCENDVSVPPPTRELGRWFVFRSRRGAGPPPMDRRTDGRHHDLWDGHQADGSMCTVETASSQAQLWGEAWLILWDRPTHCRKLLSEPLRAAPTNTTN